MALRVVAVQRDEGDEAVDRDGWRCSSGKTKGSSIDREEEDTTNRGKKLHTEEGRFWRKKKWT